jgi:hypothetical protein
MTRKVLRTLRGQDPQARFARVPIFFIEGSPLRSIVREQRGKAALPA